VRKSVALRPQKTSPVSVAALASALGLVHHGPDATVTGVALASGAIVPGDVFVALRGANRHGGEFWPDARAAGATAVFTDDEGLALLEDSKLPILHAVDPRALLGAVSAEIYGTRSASMPTILGVTGTNGKTSTAFLVEAIMRGVGARTALSTTALRQVNGETFASTLTTPEAPDIHAMIARASEDGVTAIALEISAQALDKNRMDQVVCDVAGFTNLSHDHLEDFHTMENYRDAKAALFRPDKARQAVICVDTKWGQHIAGHLEIPCTTLGRRGRVDAQWVWDIVAVEQGLTTLVLESHLGEVVEIVVPLSGEHMISNTALATLMVVRAGVSLEDLAAVGPGTAGIPVFIPGRMEKVSGSSGPQVFVDAGRSADAYEQTLQALRSSTPGRLIMVCGTSGNRDATKRPIMGRTAAELADVVIVTDDDPRREDPDLIRSGLLEGARSVSGADVHEIPHPSDAIRFALTMAEEGDTILWSGPGSQDYRDIGGVKVPYSARSEAQQALRDAGWSPPS
jgi:UDP-N-acetylmuramoyl-L-alanyl-D-glutamate--2,6-diaminopimelate ligase